MPKRKGIAAVIFLLPLFLCLSSGEGGEAAGTGDFLGKIVNFLILFGGLTYLLYKPVRGFLDKRASDIERSLVEAESSRKESQARREASKTRLAGLSEEIGKLKTEANSQGQKEKDRIIGLMDKEGRKIKILAGQEIERYAQAGIRDLKEFIAAGVTSLAREKIREKLAPEDHVRLIDQSIERLSKLNDESNAG